jgi:exopolyphosphatase/guanosine-5'-triphosphate,3'-diphosphate pyrophosphatase
VTVVDRGRLAFSHSLPLGSVRLTEGFVRSDPLAIEDEKCMREHVRAVLCEQLPLDLVRGCQTVVGSAGTIGALGNFIRRRPSGPRVPPATGRLRSSFSFRELERACLALRAMDLAKRQQTRGIEEKRAEIIVAGSLLLHEICRHVEARTVKVVRRGLRDGLMLDEIERLGAPPPLPAAEPAASPRPEAEEPAGSDDQAGPSKPRETA